MKSFSFSGPLEEINSSLGWSHIVYLPEDCISHLGEKRNPRVKVTYNDTAESHVSVKSRGEERYLVLNAAVRRKIGAVKGQVIHVLVEEETSEYGMPMPETLSEMLAQDEQANEHFQALTPGNQRNLIHLVAKVKSIDSQIAKCMGIVAHLKEHSGVIEYKALNEKIKYYNQLRK